MGLSPAAEEAFSNAIESAYVVQDAIGKFGRFSDEVEFAEYLYCYWMRKYYAAREEDRRNDWWENHCAKHPTHPGCKDYDI